MPRDEEETYFITVLVPRTPISTNVINQINSFDSTVFIYVHFELQLPLTPFRPLSTLDHFAAAFLYSIADIDLFSDCTLLRIVIALLAHDRRAEQNAQQKLLHNILQYKLQLAEESIL